MPAICKTLLKAVRISDASGDLWSLAAYSLNEGISTCLQNHKVNTSA